MPTYYVIDPDIGAADYDRATKTWTLDWSDAQIIEADSVQAAVDISSRDAIEEQAQSNGHSNTVIFVAEKPDGSDAKSYYYEVRVEWTYRFGEDSVKFRSSTEKDD